MAISFVGSPAAATGTTTATTAGRTTVSGNTIIVVCDNTSAAAINACTVTDSKTNVWTRAASKFISSVGDIEVWYCMGIAGGASHTFTNTGSAGNGMIIAVYEFRGLNVKAALDTVGAGNSATNTSVDVGVVNNRSSDGLLIAAVGAGNTASSVTVGAGWSGLLTASNNGFLGAEYKTVSTSSSNSGAAAFTLGASVLYNGIQLSFSPQHAIRINNIRPHLFSPGLAR